MRIVLMSLLMIPLAVGCNQDCMQDLEASGVFQMGDANFNFSEQLGEGLDFGTRHKIDIDTYEAGCISTIGLELSQGGRGCKMDFTFASTGDGSFNLSSFAFKADSFCPNFPDHTEGVYRTVEVVLLEVSGVPSQVEMETGTEEEVCLDDIEYTFFGSGTLLRDGSATEHSFSLELTVFGDYISKGSTSAVCTT